MSGFQNQNRNVRISPRLVLVGCTLILLSLACNLPLMANQTTGNQEKPAGFVETSIVETMAAIGQEQTTGADDQSEQPDPSSATFTPESTDIPTLTPTVTETPTPDVPMVYISGDTNCRTGPGTIYDWLVTVLKGEEAETVAKDPLGEYWYIRQPGQEGSFCWLWGKFATPVGDTASLPVFTPPPTPTPSLDFSVSYHHKETTCAQYALVYKIINTGGFTLESWKTTAVDHTGGSSPTVYIEDKFLEVVGCAVVSQQMDLTPGEGHYLMMVFDNNPTGNDITITIKICTENGLAGECLEKIIRHTP